MGKYTPLREFLIKSGEKRVPLTFARIELIIGAPLPASKQYPAWWSNNPFNNTMTQEWLAAGYETGQVDVANETLVFLKDQQVKVGMAASVNEEGLHQVFGCMAGTLTIPEGADIMDLLEGLWPEDDKSTEFYN